MTRAIHPAPELAQLHDWRKNCFYPKADYPLPDPLLRSLRDGGGMAEVKRGQVEELCRAIVQVPGSACQVPGGTFHTVWKYQTIDDRTFYLRLNAIPEWMKDYPCLIDARVMEMLASSGLPFCRVVETDFSRTRLATDFTLMEEAPGVPLTRFDEDDTRLLPLLERLGWYFGHLHQHHAEGYGLIQIAATPEEQELAGCQRSWNDHLSCSLENQLDICESQGYLGLGARKEIRHIFADSQGLFAGQGSLLHGDPGNHNIYAEKDDISCLIDWEDALVGDPIYDIAFWATFHPERRHAAFLAGYRSSGELPSDFLQRFWVYYLRIAIAKTVVRYRAGLSDRPGRVPAAYRIQAAMKRLLVPAQISIQGFCL